MVVASDLYESLITDSILKKEYTARELILDCCTENHILGLMANLQNKSCCKWK